MLIDEDYIPAPKVFVDSVVQKIIDLSEKFGFIGRRSLQKYVRKREENPLSEVSEYAKRESLSVLQATDITKYGPYKLSVMIAQELSGKEISKIAGHHSDPEIIDAIYRLIDKSLWIPHYKALKALGYPDLHFFITEKHIPELQSIGRQYGINTARRARILAEDCVRAAYNKAEGLTHDKYASSPDRSKSIFDDSIFNIDKLIDTLSIYLSQDFIEYTQRDRLNLVIEHIHYIKNEELKTIDQELEKIRQYIDSIEVDIGVKINLDRPILLEGQRKFILETLKTIERLGQTYGVVKEADYAVKELKAKMEGINYMTPEQLESLGLPPDSF